MLYYAWEHNNLKPGTYFARVLPRTTIESSDLVESVARGTLIQPEDIRAVLDALFNVVAMELRKGNQVVVDDILRLRIGLELKDPDSATSGDKKLLLDEVTPRVRVTLKPKFIKKALQNIELAAGDPFMRLPKILHVFDVATKQKGFYSLPGPLTIVGRYLDLVGDFENDPRQGVFFINPATKEEYRAEVYVRSGRSKITCMIPEAVQGEVNIEVRTTYGGLELRSGAIEGVAQSVG